VYRDAVEMHEHKLTVLYRAELKQVLLPLLQQNLQQKGVQATVIEGNSCEWRCLWLYLQKAMFHRHTGI
jgi:hypothetical protein